MASSLAWRRVAKRYPCSRSTFNDPNTVLLQALSQQLPRRLIDAVMQYARSTSLKSWLAYWVDCPCHCGRSTRPACLDGA